MHVALQLIHKLFVNGLSGRVAGEKPFLSKGYREQRPRYATLYKNWTEHQCRWVLYSGQVLIHTAISSGKSLFSKSFICQYETIPNTLTM